MRFARVNASQTSTTRNHPSVTHYVFFRLLKAERVERLDLKPTIHALICTDKPYQRDGRLTTVILTVTGFAAFLFSYG